MDRAKRRLGLVARASFPAPRIQEPAPAHEAEGAQQGKQAHPHDGHSQRAGDRHQEVDQEFQYALHMELNRQAMPGVPRAD